MGQAEMRFYGRIYRGEVVSYIYKLRSSENIGKIER